MAAFILVADDEEPIRELLRFNLENEGFRTLFAADGETAMKLVQQRRPDLILLDLMLPKLDGFEVCRRIKSDPQTAQIPVVILTARDTETDKVLGLELGADDYVTKPFSPRELMARVKTKLRRRGVLPAIFQEAEKEILRGLLAIYPERFRVFLRNREIKLSVKEFALLLHLAMRPGRVFTRGELLSAIWGYELTGETRTVDVHIRYLRRKLEADPEDPQFIETIRGMGYRFKEP
ncbi:MAG: response regulator transcription factor [Bacillota bacterium]